MSSCWEDHHIYVYVNRLQCYNGTDLGTIFACYLLFGEVDAGHLDPGLLLRGRSRLFNVQQFPYSSVLNHYYYPLSPFTFSACFLSSSFSSISAVSPCAQQGDGKGEGHTLLRESSARACAHWDRQAKWPLILRACSSIVFFKNITNPWSDGFRWYIWIIVKLSWVEFSWKHFQVLKL